MAASTSPPSGGSVEVLTIKEYARQISGLSEHTIRQLVLQNKLLHIQIGQGKRKKIPVESWLPNALPPINDSVEMLILKECVQLNSGLSEHSIR